MSSDRASERVRLQSDYVSGAAPLLDSNLNVARYRNRLVDSFRGGGDWTLP
jgi:hypothetical protein